MDTEGLATDFLRNMDWDNFDMFTVTREVMDQISKPVGEFFLKHTGKGNLDGSGTQADIDWSPIEHAGFVKR